MLADQASHFEHGHLSFAENFFEFGVCIDHALVDCVLQFVFLDVNPQFRNDFSAGMAAAPTTAANALLKVNGFMKAALGTRFFAGAFGLAAFLAAGFFAATFLAGAALQVLF